MRLLNNLIEQAKKPNGRIGRIMVSIMNSAHSNMTLWGLNQISIQEDSVVLDIGCGGGNTLHLLGKWIKTGQILGVDYSDAAVKKSIQKNKQAVKDGLVIS